MNEQHNSLPSIVIFYSSSGADEKLWKELEIHLHSLRNQNTVKNWSVYPCISNRNYSTSVVDMLGVASVVLLLISPDFLASDACKTITEQIIALQASPTVVDAGKRKTIQEEKRGES